MQSTIPFRIAAWRRPRASFALVIVLSMVALLSITLITFVVVMRNERAASFSYSQSVKADDIAQGGANLVIQYLRQEIMDTNRSTETLDPSGSGAVTYVPSSSTYAVAERMAAAAIDPSLTNLVKISSATVPFYVGTTVPLASPSNTGTTSLNGRLLTQTRWNRPQLIDAPAVSKLVLPDWIVLTRSGTTNVWNNALKDQTSDNAAIGRFSFVVYDVGGLLDVNSAGYPSSASGSTPARQKGLLPFADLTQIPGITNAAIMNSFVQWRSPASSSNAASFTNYVYNYGVTNGFLKVAPGDQAFVSRQDLIQYVQSNPSVIGAAALPYLTTFTRELNGPAFSPTTPTGSTISYASLATNSGATNVNFAAFRDAAGRTLSRFPLSRIGLLNYATPGAASGANAANILTYFGLKLDADGYSWDYQYPASPTAGGIMTLSAIVAAGREPNFFELLQAGILNGSLGLSVYQNPQYTGNQASDYFDASKTRQIFAIGANIIDQYKTNSMPTVINIPSDTAKMPVAGMENIPSITQTITSIYRPTLTDTGSSDLNYWYRNYVTVLVGFEVWNPNQNATNLPTSGPTNFRVVAHDGVSSLKVYTQTSLPPVDYGGTNDYGTPYAADSSGNPTPFQIQFTNQTAFCEPTLLTTANSVNYDPNGTFPGGSYPLYSGIDEGICLAPDFNVPGDGWEGTNNFVDHVEVIPQEPPPVAPPSLPPFQTYSVTYDAQFLDAKGNWQTYQRFPYTGANGAYYDGNSGYYGFNYQWLNLNVNNGEGGAARVDPRGSRWAETAIGVYNPSVPGTPWDYTQTGQSLRPTRTASNYGTLGVGGGFCGPVLASSNFWPPGDKNWAVTAQSYPATVGDNDSTTQSSSSTTKIAGYYDLDNVVRHADGNGSQGVFPMAPALGQSVGFVDRPLILNRPFRSVGELGYAYRDMPWKTLDFSRGESADAGLLDIFTANDDVDASTPPVVAGKVNLNTRRPEVLAALLSGAGVQEYSNPNLNLSGTNALLIANNIVSTTTAKPFLTKADLVANFGNAEETTFNLPASSAYPAYSPRKTEREAIVRGLADAGQTRTWNFLIDVVAQVGKYPPNATSFNQFNVEGERRYWLHVAIDRYTGKVVDAHLEPVYE